MYHFWFDPLFVAEHIRTRHQDLEHCKRVTEGLPDTPPSNQRPAATWPFVNLWATLQSIMR